MRTLAIDPARGTGATRDSARRSLADDIGALRRLEAEGCRVELQVASQAAELDGGRLPELVDEFHRGEFVRAIEREAHAIEVRSLLLRGESAPLEVAALFDRDGDECVV